MKQTYRAKLINLKFPQRPVVFSKGDVLKMDANSIINNYLNDYSIYF